jgi:4-hydroxybenzoate polyprenyltransferase
MKGLRKYYQYSQERFPVLPLLVYAAAFFYAAYFFADFFGSIEFSVLKTIGGMFTLFLVSLHLRLLDEHKDYEQDLKAHPERMLSQGIIKLSELRVILYIVLIIEIVLNILFGIQQLLLLGAMILYSLIMFKEFFVSQFLNRHMGLYLLTHQLIVILFVFYAYSFAADLSALSTEAFLYLLLFSLGIMGLTIAFEIGRKTWAAEQEHEYAESYSKSWGIKKAVFINQLTAFLGTGIVLFFFYRTGVHFLFFILVGLVYLLFLITEINFLKDPVVKKAKAVEGAGMLFVILTLIASAVGFYIV